MKMRWTLGYVSLVLALSLSCSGEKVKVDIDAVNDIEGTSSGDAVDGRAGLETVEPDACVPQCVAGSGSVKECGNDGCGGTCGTCPDGYDCVDAGYGATSCFSQDECLSMCNERGLECGSFSPFWEGDDSIICDCGDCHGEDVCLDYGDEESYCCTPDCEGKDCGDNGCEGSCGECGGEQQACVDNKCICQPNCDGKDCGPDGCGGACGECAETDLCCAGGCHPQECTVSNQYGECLGLNECVESEVVCNAGDPEDEECNGLDDDCDGDVDEGFPDWNNDGIANCGDNPDPDDDGVPDWEDNCLDDYNPNQENNDQDTLGDVCDPDDDNDGTLDEQDCEPFNKNVYPGHEEYCNGLDDNCNGEIDEGYGPDYDGNGVPDACEGDEDEDGDGIVTPEDNCPLVPNPMQENNDWDDMGDACDPDDDNDLYLDDDDCDPFDPEIHPGADEPCDGKDNNCNGKADEGYPDQNGNGIPDCMEPPDNDPDGDGCPDEIDCDPYDPEIGECLDEWCDGKDNNCNFEVDEGYPDTDSDAQADCVDTDDDNDQILDVNDNCPKTYNPNQMDSDGDGFGDICDGGCWLEADQQWDKDCDGWSDELDCEPYDPEIHPGANELCDDVDNNCNWQIDEGCQ